MPLHCLTAATIINCATPLKAEQAFTTLEKLDTPLHDAIYGGRTSERPPMYVDHDMQIAADDYLQKQRAMEVRTPLEQLKARADELAEIATKSAGADVETIMVLQESERRRFATDSMEAHRSAMVTMDDLCQKVRVRIRFSRCV
jgi:hypothetical protein